MKVGDTITARRHAGLDVRAGDKILLSSPGSGVSLPPDSEFEVFTRVGADGKLSGVCGVAIPTRLKRIDVVGNPLTVVDLLALGTLDRAACESALKKRDACFGFNGPDSTYCISSTPDVIPCVYGADGGTSTSSGGVMTVPSGDAGSTTTSANAAPASTNDDAGCSTTRASAPASVAVLLAVVGAMLARRRLSR